MKTVLKYILIFVALIVFFVISLTLIALIPSEAIKENVAESAIELNNYGEYPVEVIFNKEFVFDNYTDALMINNAYSMDPNDPLYSALVVRRSYIPGVTTHVLDEEIGDPVENIKETENLLNVVEGKDIISKKYSKYWHGYLLFLKPLLLVFNYSQLRVLQLILIILLGVTLLFLIFKKIGLPEAIAFLISFLMVDIQFVFFSLECTPLFIIMFIVSILMITDFIKDKKKLIFVSGILTCFFDFLTAPIITLAIPLILYFLVKQKDESMSFKEIIKDIFISCVLWLLGYALTWISKFVLVYVLCNENIIHAAIMQIFHRTFEKSPYFEVTWFNALKFNFIYCNYFLFVLCIALESFYLGNLALGKGKYVYKTPYKKIKKKISLMKCVPYLIIMMMPIAWYVVLQSHSILHDIFTYRMLSAFWICSLLLLNEINKIFKET